MRVALAAAVLLGLFSLSVAAAELDAVTLSLPRPLHPDDRLAIGITVGPIGRQQIVVRSETGDRLGTISLFAIRAGRAGGSYVIPVPTSTVRGGKLKVRLTIIENGQSRPPTTEEVTGIELLQTSN